MHHNWQVDWQVIISFLKKNVKVSITYSDYANIRSLNESLETFIERHIALDHKKYVKLSDRKYEAKSDCFEISFKFQIR